MPRESFENHIKNCDLLIAHSGVGAIITGSKYGKPVIVIPRLAKYKEHVDDHQVQIAEAFASENLILKCEEGDNIEVLINKALKHKFGNMFHKGRK